MTSAKRIWILALGSCAALLCAIGLIAGGHGTAGFWLAVIGVAGGAESLLLLLSAKSRFTDDPWLAGAYATAEVTLLGGIAAGIAGAALLAGVLHIRHGRIALGVTGLIVFAVCAWNARNTFAGGRRRSRQVRVRTLRH